MNKKLVAVAIAGLLAAPLAQAQTANVTLYGRLNMDFEFVNGRHANNTNPTLPCSSNSSRFGLRGTESLGGGVNAVFQIESSIRPVGYSGKLAGRDSFLGFQGDGSVRIGRFHAPYDNIHEIWGRQPDVLTCIMATAALWAQGFAAEGERRLRRSRAAIRCGGIRRLVGLPVQMQLRPRAAQNSQTERTTRRAIPTRRVRPLLQQRSAGHRRRVTSTHKQRGTSQRLCPTRRGRSRPSISSRAQDRRRVRKDGIRVLNGIGRSPGHGTS